MAAFLCGFLGVFLVLASELAGKYGSARFPRLRLALLYLGVGLVLLSLVLFLFLLNWL